MLKKHWLQIILVGGFLCLSLMLFFSNQRSKANTIPDTPETKAVMEAMTRAYELLDTPIASLDIEQLSEIFVDHPDYLKEINEDTQIELQAQIQEFLGPESAKSVGYLTSLKAKRVFQKQGEEMLRKALASASAEKRELTEAEWQELARKNHGLQPSLSDTPSVINKRELKYFSIEITGDKAKAQYDEGVTGRTAILVQIDGRWYVAGIF